MEQRENRVDEEIIEEKASKNTSGASISELQQELSAAKKRIEKLELDLKAAREEQSEILEEYITLKQENAHLRLKLAGGTGMQTGKKNSPKTK